MNKHASTRFVIVGTYRTGSSALGEALSTHPRIACGWEWTLYTPAWRKLDAGRRALSGDFSALSTKHQDRMREILTPAKAVLGYKRLFRSSDKYLVHPRFSPALLVDRLEAHLRWWRGDPAIHVVHIVRRDNLAWLKSKTLADASGQYTGGLYPETLRVKLDLREARRRVVAKDWIDARLASLQDSNPYCCVDYEQFLADNRGTVSSVVRFLGCDPAELPEVNLRHQPQARPNNSTLIVNLDEVRRAIEAPGRPSGP